MTDLDKYDLGLTDEEGDAFMAAIREARRGPDPLAALRADYAAVVADRTLAHGDRWPDRWAAREHALTGVLDLIDKQREGQ